MVIFMDRQILHIDVNNAFLSWTAIDMLKNGYKVDIRTIPAVIGGDESRRAGIKSKLLANVVNVQIRDNGFKDHSHQGKVEVATCSTKIIYNKAKELLEELYKGEDIRLIGLRVDNLVEKKEQQITLFSNKNIEKQEKLDSVLDELKNKYGYSTISRAGKMNVDDMINNIKKGT